MPAWRILRLARTRRCAMVDSGTRNARAISGVVSPASVRSVSATCASTVNAGWQHVKMRRRRSSSIPLSPTSSCGCGSGSLVPASTATSCSLAAPVADLRRRSMARLRAAVVSQAPGLRGTPSRGQCCTASAKASCAHSSARSQSPVTRMRVATTRPHSSAKASATAVSTELTATQASTGLAAPVASGLAAPVASAGSHLPDRPHLDRAEASPRDLRGDLDGLVEVLAVDQEEAAHLLLRLGERAVGGDDLALADPHGGGVGRGTQALASLQDAPLHHLLGEDSVLGRARRGLLGAERGVRVLVAADEQCITHDVLLVVGCSGRSPPLRRTAGPRSTAIRFIRQEFTHRPRRDIVRTR